LARTARLAVVGSDSLIGREIRDLVAESSFASDVSLIAAGDEEAGKITEQSGEPAFVVPLEPKRLESADIIFLAGPAESTKSVLEFSPEAGVIDFSYAAEDNSNARLRAPMAEPPGYRVSKDSPQVIANSAAIAMAVVLTRLHAVHPVRRAVAQVFEPASERGAAGLDELQRQTISLLSFKSQPREIFDAQLAFNLLPRLGEAAPVPLEESEVRVERHLASLLSASGKAPMPSLRVIQAPVFHGYSISLWVEFEANPGVARIERALDSDPIDVRTGDTEPPHIVGMAGQNGVAVSVAGDRNNPKACWLWIVADNLRLRAENAILVAEQLV
jgi:aspartate-semialdehyde dehydrogenase